MSKDLADARGCSWPSRGDLDGADGRGRRGLFRRTWARAACRRPPPRAAARPCASSTASCWARAGATTTPRAGSRRPKAGRPLPKVLSRDAVERLIAAAAAKDGGQGLRLACMIELLYASGLRISELLNLPLAALARDPAFLMVKGKGGKERLAPLNDAARTAVKAYLEARPQFLPKGDQGKPLAVPLARQGLGPADRPAGLATAGGRRHRRRHRSRERSAPTSCATPSPPTCWKAAPTCGSSRPCWATPTSPPPRSTPTWRAITWRRW
jgi:integrase/recombinase XerD